MNICGHPTVMRLVRMHRCAGWPGCVQVAKVNHFQFQQDKGYSVDEIRFLVSSIEILCLNMIK